MPRLRSLGACADLDLSWPVYCCTRSLPGTARISRWLPWEGQGGLTFAASWGRDRKWRTWELEASAKERLPSLWRCCCDRFDLHILLRSVVSFWMLLPTFRSFLINWAVKFGIKRNRLPVFCVTSVGCNWKFYVEHLRVKCVCVFHCIFVYRKHLLLRGGVSQQWW